MDKSIREALKSVVVAGQKLIKAGNAIVDAQFGEGIRKSASETTAAIINAGYAEASRKTVLEDELLFNKEAVFDSLRRFAERQSVIDGLNLGTAEEVKKASHVDSKDDYWNKLWGF